ncbi:MAG: hotdog fold thioesterase [Chitinophagales bacterium]|jgi:1,4-dihydroxy-2-naphthoyl-CoA hydrolase|nr:hotdog fold thioesterase [Chitinophagales bacterium]MBP6154758.1 hotdog fold thioesterase [Chitinophagales bacterium]HQV78948.1 hotdog fold thioesterase [Chitinophagales bacterium]HQW68177.1 hotdog fold thioesterase [Flavobacterium sp.]HQW68220.1 hotdog fold thioesterase [Flavobacterium sp.]
MSIWKFKEISLDGLRMQAQNTMVEYLGIEYTEIGDDYLVAKMPVDQRTHQPMGLLHGGAHVVLAETLGSTAANLCLDISKEYALGLDINSNHLKSVRNGYVYGIAKPIHIGSKTQVWEIKIYDEKENLLNISRLTMMVLKHV